MNVLLVAAVCSGGFGRTADEGKFLRGDEVGRLLPGAQVNGKCCMVPIEVEGIEGIVPIGKLRSF